MSSIINLFRSRCNQHLLYEGRLYIINFAINKKKCSTIFFHCSLFMHPGFSLCSRKNSIPYAHEQQKSFAGSSGF